MHRCNHSSPLAGTMTVVPDSPADPAGPLYTVGETSDRRLGALVSHDNGATWQDHAVIPTPFAAIYAVGGCRQPTPDGRIIGTFTGRANPGDPWRTYFYSFQALPRDPR